MKKKLKDTKTSNTHLIRQSFWGYCCKSGIAIFAKRVTSNYACTVPLSLYLCKSSIIFSRKFQKVTINSDLSPFQIHGHHVSVNNKFSVIFLLRNNFTKLIEN